MVGVTKSEEEIMAAGDRIRKANTQTEPFKKSTGRVSYPNRTSLDLNDEQYEWLKEVAWQNRESAAGFLRLIIDQLRAHPERLERVLRD